MQYEASRAVQGNMPTTRRVDATWLVNSQSDLLSATVIPLRFQGEVGVNRYLDNSKIPLNLTEGLK